VISLNRFFFGVAIMRNRGFTQKPENLELLGTAFEAEFKAVDENKN
jgi:hypothetical protein